MRTAEFPQKPLRFESAFAFVTVEGALWWRAHERHGALLYAVEPVDASAPWHIGDLLGVNRIVSVDASEEAAARRYWRRSPPLMLTPDRVTILEFLTAGSLKVVKALG